MSLTERRTDYPATDVRRAARRQPRPPEQDTAAPRAADAARGTVAAKAAHSAQSKAIIAKDAGLHAPSPIIPAQTVTGRALLAMIAIMSFLAAMTLGAVVLVRHAAGEWQGQVSRELTIQVRPMQGRDIDADVTRAAAIARSAPGVASVRAFTRAESAALLEPWLGSLLSLEELPVPRVIVVTVEAGQTIDHAALRRQLTAQVPNATLDDHRAWVERMRSITQGIVTTGFGVLALMMAATVLLVIFATRSAMIANRAIVEVLHFVGAKNRFIAGQFQRHFLLVGLKGAAIGGGAAAALFLAAGLLRGQQSLLDPQIAALAGAASLGPDGYGGILGLLVLIGTVTALASRWTVHRTLNTLD